MFTLRFDMRAPDWGARIEDLYAAAIEMAAWAEGRGAVVTVLSEHHATDGPPPARRRSSSPSAIAARTETPADHGRGGGAAVLRAGPPGRGHGGARHHQPGPGRLRARRRPPTGGVRALRPRDERARRPGRRAAGDADRAPAGERSTSPGRSTRITPAPTSGGPQLFIGGGSLRAARRAGRFGLGLIAQSRDTRPGRGLRGGVSGGRPRAGVRPDPGAGLSRRRCSSPTTSTGPGTSSVATCCTTR